MASRNRATRLLPDNVLGSALRETAREARRSRRRDTSATSGAHDVAQLVTDSTGVARWTYDTPVPDTNLPVVVATGMCSGAVIISIRSVSNTNVVLYAYTLAGRPVRGVPVHAAVFAGRRPEVQ